MKKMGNSEPDNEDIYISKLFTVGPKVPWEKSEECPFSLSKE